MNFLVVVDSGSQATARYVSAPLTTAAAPGNVVAARVSTSRAVRMTRFPRFRPMDAQVSRAIRAAGGITGRPDDNIICKWQSYGSEYEDATRIGEIHVANLTGATDKYEFVNQADSTISVGFSGAPGSGFSAGGSITLTNSMGTNGGFTAGPGTIKYVDGHIYYQRYQNNGAADCPPDLYKAQAENVVGDAYEGTNSPKPNPWGNCSNDPHGLAKMQSHGGFFDTDLGKAEGYSGIATVWGFGFSGSTGFTTDIKHNYSDNGTVDMYVCGSKAMPDVPVLYES